MRPGQKMYEPDDELRLINDKQHTGCQALEATPIGRRDAIPEFWRAHVNIVDAIKIHVFSVPREVGFPHPKIQVSCKIK